MSNQQMPKSGQTGKPFVTVEVRWTGPLDIPASLEGFRRWGDDRIDRWDGECLVRTARVGDAMVPFACTVTGTVNQPAVRVTVLNKAYLSAITCIVKNMFVTAPEALSQLMEADSLIAGIEGRYRGVRPVLQTDLFTNLIRSISAQQVNLRWAVTTRRRLVEMYGQSHSIDGQTIFSVDPARLAATDPSSLRKLQFTTRKAEYIVALARAVTEGSLDLEALRDRSDDEVQDQLTRLRGIGRWTAEWFLARALGRPCVAAGDLGVRKAIGAVYLQGDMPSEAEVRQLTAHWGLAAGVAQQLVLHALSQGVESS